MIFKLLFSKYPEFQSKHFFFDDYGWGTLSSSIAFAQCFLENNSSRFNESYRLIDGLELSDYRTHSTYINGNLSQFNTDRENQGDQIPKGKDYIITSLLNGYWFHDQCNSIHQFCKELVCKGFFQDPFEVDDKKGFANSAYVQHSYFPSRLSVDSYFIGNFKNLDPFNAFRKKIGENASVVSVLNLSYVLASDSVEIGGLIDKIQLYKSKSTKVVVVYQNPTLSQLNEKWNKLVNDLSKKFTVKVNYDKHLPIKYYTRSVVNCKILTIS